MPKVSVVMAVYNGEKYLQSAIDSILTQTFYDFEFIIVDDASTDETANIIKGYKDSRVKLITNEVNMRLPRSLNRGLSAASGNYIVRMDADDISLPNRIEKQVLFMDNHPEVAASSVNYIVIDEEGHRLSRGKVHCGKVLNRYALLPSPLVHPGAIIRRSLLNEEEWYNEKYTSAQDYDLWLRIHEHHLLDNINEALLLYRVHSASISQAKKNQQRCNAYEIFNKFSSKQISFDEFEMLTYNSFEKNPMEYAKLMYVLFSHLDNFYFTRVLSYTYHWFKQK